VNNGSYPHLIINVEDDSIASPVVTDFLPLNVPLYAMKTQRGPIGVPVYCPQAANVMATFGAETLNELNKAYFSTSSVFINKCFPKNGAYVVRLADDTDAATAWTILEVGLTPNAAVVQYSKDAYGNYVLDDAGDPVPVASDGSELEAGLDVEWATRTALIAQEDFDNLQPRTVDATVWYPIMTFKAVSPGVWGNDQAFQLFYDQDSNDQSRVDRAGSLYFNCSIAEKEYGGSSADIIKDKYNNNIISSVLKPDVIDTSVAMRVSMDDVLAEAFSADSNATLPYAIKVYSDNVVLVGDAIRAVEVNRTDELEDAWYVNPVSLVDLDGKPYDHVKFTVDSLVLVENSNIYLANGTDGLLDEATRAAAQAVFDAAEQAANDADNSYVIKDYDWQTVDEYEEKLFVDFLELDMNPDIVDKARYPFTHIYDVGWSLEPNGGKYAMCAFMGIREDVKVVLSTQCTKDINGAGAYNTETSDLSSGQALRARAMLVRESVIKGTGAFRAAIFAQAGLLNDSNYKGIVPATLWYAEKLAGYHNTGRMNGAPEGLPEARVDLFKSWNWAPSSDSQKMNAWDGGLNYFQYADRNKLHYASLHSVYAHETSVLAIDDFTNAVVYSKHALRLSWAQHAGMTLPAADLEDAITRDITKRLLAVFNGRYTLNVLVYQTDQDKVVGYIQRVRLEITSPANKRVWSVDIVTKRENFEG